MKKGNMIASSVVALWGAAILLTAFFRDQASEGGAYGYGQLAALVFAVVMVVLGVRGIRTELRRRARA